MISLRVGKTAALLALLLSASTVLAQPLAISGGGTGATTATTALTNLGTGAVGTSVNTPGTTTTLQVLVPVQTETGGTYTFSCTDMFQMTRRSNSGTAMSDTLPASGACVGGGIQLEISNVDASAVDTITASGSTTINGSSSITLPPGRSLWLAYDSINLAWRPVANSDTAILSSQVLLGTSNTVFGSSAGISTGGSNNSFFGVLTGLNNTTGVDNVFVGYNAGAANTTGADNVYIGVRAGNQANGSAPTGNIAIGTDAGYSNISGENNVYIGYQAGKASTGSDDYFIGFQAGLANTTGDDNFLRVTRRV